MQENRQLYAPVHLQHFEVFENVFHPLIPPQPQSLRRRRLSRTGRVRYSCHDPTRGHEATAEQLSRLGLCDALCEALAKLHNSSLSQAPFSKPAVSLFDSYKKHRECKESIASRFKQNLNYLRFDMKQNRIPAVSRSLIVACIFRRGC